MLPCPRCATRMQRRFLRRGVTWVCATCGGRTATVPMLRRVLGRRVVQGLWRAEDTAPGPEGPCCPSCRHRMREVEVRAPGGAQTLDTCRRCHFVWFDPGEYRALAAAGPLGESMRPIGPTGDDRAERGASRAPRQREQRSPAEGWKWLPGLLGMPVEFESRPLAGRPVITWGLLALILGFGAFALQNLEPLVRRYAFFPSDPLRLAGLTPLASFFLHAGWLHLLGNAYFLWIFGDNTEDTLGSARYLLLLVIATYAGAAAHAVTTATPDTPCVGASGGISGVIAYYAFRFPRMRLGLLFYFVFWLRLSAIACFLLWVVLQLLGAYLALGNVAYAAHLGGALVGVAFWLLDPDRPVAEVSERGRRRRRRTGAPDEGEPEQAATA